MGKAKTAFENGRLQARHRSHVGAVPCAAAPLGRRGVGPSGCRLGAENRRRPWPPSPILPRRRPSRPPVRRGSTPAKSCSRSASRSGWSSACSRFSTSAAGRSGAGAVRAATAAAPARTSLRTPVNGSPGSSAPPIGSRRTPRPSRSGPWRSSSCSRRSRRSCCGSTPAVSSCTSTRSPPGARASAACGASTGRPPRPTSAGASGSRSPASSPSCSASVSPLRP